MKRIDRGHDPQHRINYIRRQIPKLQEQGHDTASLEELIEKKIVAEPAPAQFLLDLKSLLNFFYEEPDRYSDMVEHICKAEVPIEAMREELAREGYWAGEDSLAAVAAELLTNPPN